MTDLIFSDRMREAAVVLPQTELEQYRSAVDDLAAAKFDDEFLLGLVRLAYGRDAGSDFREAFAEQLARRSLSLDGRAEQLMAVLATETLIERFSRPTTRRTQKALAPDGIAAMAVVVLADQDEPPIHPDLASFALQWTHGLSDYLRSTGTLKPPPQLPLLLSKFQEPSETTSEGATTTEPDSDELVAELAPYVGELSDWLRRSSSAGRVRALEEGQSISWWLLSSRSSAGDAAEEVVAASAELLSLCSFLPGPPAWNELLARRLGPAVAASVDLQKVAALSERQVPDSVSDFCLLLNGLSNYAEATAPAKSVASWLYHERQLVQMFESKDGER